jgi:hypothetical protein
MQYTCIIYKLCLKNTIYILVLFINYALKIPSIALKQLLKIKAAFENERQRVYPPRFF